MSISQTAEGWWVIDEDTHVSHWVRECKRLDHDQWMLGKLFRYIRPGDVVIDIGAHIGDHTIAYSDWVGPTGKVVAFEPETEAYQCITRNLQHRMNVEIFCDALSTSYTWATLERIENNFGSTYLTKNKKDYNKIQVRNVDSFEFRHVDFIKIDAEGSEPSILEGAQETLAKFRPVLCIEINQLALERQGSCEGHLLEMLNFLKYKNRVMLQDERVQPNAAPEAPQYDIVARWTP